MSRPGFLSLFAANEYMFLYTMPLYKRNNCNSVFPTSAFFFICCVCYLEYNCHCCCWTSLLLTKFLPTTCLDIFLLQFHWRSFCCCGSLLLVSRDRRERKNERQHQFCLCLVVWYVYDDIHFMLFCFYECEGIRRRWWLQPKNAEAPAETCVK